MFTLEMATEIVEILSDYGIEAEVREDYSGRAMFGKTCVGIVTGASGVMIGFAAALAVIRIKESSAEHSDDVMDAIRDFDFKRGLPTRTDSMGFETIYY